jgi:hypothetical protein
MALAGLMADTGKDVGHRQLEGLFIITDNAAQAIAQRLNGLKHAAFQGLVIRRQQGGYLQYQAELQLACDIQGRVAFLGLEGINGQKEPVPTKVRGMLFQPQLISATQQHEKDANQIQHFTFGDGHLTFLSEHFMNLGHGPAFPKPPVANLDNDLQGKTTPAKCQAASRFRGVESIMSGTARRWTMVAQVDHQKTTCEKDDVFPSDRVTTFQGLSTARARGLLWSVVAFWNSSSAFRSSHCDASARNSEHKIGADCTVRKACR